MKKEQLNESQFLTLLDAFEDYNKALENLETAVIKKIDSINNNLNALGEEIKKVEGLIYQDVTPVELTEEEERALADQVDANIKEAKINEKSNTR